MMPVVMSIPCLEMGLMDTDSKDWIDFIRGELAFNREHIARSQQQGQELLSRLTALENYSRERLDHIVLEVRANNEDSEAQTENVLLELRSFKEAATLKLHSLELDVVRLQMKAGIWGFVAGLISTIGALLWLWLTKKWPS